MMVRPSVLVVDDDVSITDFLVWALEEYGYTVLTAVGAGALTLAHDSQPGLILLDIQMPGMDGIEISRRLRADPSTAHIPIVVMSAQDRLVGSTIHMAVDDQLAKPFRLERLYEMVGRWTAP